jgi:hypothetical protein
VAPRKNQCGPRSEAAVHGRTGGVRRYAEDEGEERAVQTLALPLPVHVHGDTLYVRDYVQEDMGRNAHTGHGVITD